MSRSNGHRRVKNVRTQELGHADVHLNENHLYVPLLKGTALKRLFFMIINGISLHSEMFPPSCYFSIIPKIAVSINVSDFQFCVIT